MRAHLLFVMVASGCAVATATACSSPDAAADAEAKRATASSAVTISAIDKAGNALGSCSGTLVAKDLVLTAGHCVAGAAKWTVVSKGADATSESTRGVTPWKAFGSNLSHPDHSDVGLLVLNTPIELSSYPLVASTKLADGAKALRFSRSSAASAEPKSSEVSVSSMSKKGFRLNYAAKIDKGAFLDTGGAIIDPKTGKIHGVVSGVGDSSGLLHIARTDNFAKWIMNAASCLGSTSLTTRTYGSSGGSSSGWGGSSSGGWGSGSGNWGGYGGSGSKVDGGTTVPGSGMDAGAGSSGSSGASGTTSGGSSGSSGTSGGSSGSSGTSGGSSGSSGSSGSMGDGDTSGAGSSCPGVPSCEGSDCPGSKGGSGGAGSSGSSGSSGSDGANGSSSGSSGAGSSGSSGSSGSDGASGSSSGSSGSSGAGSSGSSGSSGSDGTNGGSDEVCPGPPNCPEPDSQACTGAACGGCGGVSGCVDATIDYGNCASCGGSAGTGTPPVVR